MTEAVNANNEGHAEDGICASCNMAKLPGDKPDADAPCSGCEANIAAGLPCKKGG